MKRNMTFTTLAFLSCAFITCSEEKLSGTETWWEDIAIIQQHIKVDGPMGNLDTEIIKPKELLPNQKYPAVILMHGFSGRKEGPLFDAIAKGLVTKQVIVIRFDFNGHGQSEGDFKNMTIYNEIEDAKAIIQYVKKLDYVENISLLGHSQGGVIASMVAGELGANLIKKAVLMAPAAVLREDALRGYIMGINYNPRDPGEGVELPGNKMLGANYIYTAQTLPIYETSKKYTGPVLLLHGTYDVVVPYTFSEYYSYIFQNCKVCYIEGDDHGFNKEMSATALKAVDFLVK